MSIPVFIRNPDGAAWEGRIAYNWSAVRESDLNINIGENSMPSVEDAYAVYGVCSALHISQTQLSNFGKLDSVYTFLYGHTLKKLMEVKEEETYSRPGKYIYEPQEWTTQMVSSMDWDSFCLAYYTFLCAKNDFKSQIWEVLGFILNTLKSSPDILFSLLSKAGRPFDELSCSDFWETVCDGLQVRILDYLVEKTCYTAFYAMKMVRSLFSDERYGALENESFGFFDEIARARIDAAFEKTYTIKELVNLNIELLFFYKDYFEAFPAASQTEQYVTNGAFTLLQRMGDKIVATGEILGADAVYETALKYAQNEAERNLISTKRSVIASRVSVLKKKKRRKEKFEQLKENIVEILEVVFEKAFTIIFIISVLATPLFGILTLLGIFSDFSKIAFIVSICILSLYLILFAIVSIQDKRK